MKKILILTHEFPPIIGGIAIYTEQIALAASKSGHDITVLAPGSKRNSKDDKKNYPYEVIRYGAGDYSFKRLPQLIWRVYRWSKRSDYDIIHAMDWPHLLAMAYLNRYRDIPYVGTIYGTEIMLAKNSRQIRYLTGNRIFSQPRHTFAISEFTKNLLLENYKEVKPERVTVTPLGVDYKKFSDFRRDFDIHKKYSIPNSNHILLTVSRLDERKGHLTVFTALSKLEPELKRKITYIIAGSGKNKKFIERLKKLAQVSGVDVKFIGRVDNEDLPSLYAGSTLFCMPGEIYSEKVEGFGLAYLEAAAAGLPSIASRIGGVPEVVIHEKTGILIEPGDSNGLATVLTRALNENEYRAAMGREAREHARRFDWDRCAKLTYDAID
jgi:glycosyltransferase involved in cell wall biosynthesis